MRRIRANRFARIELRIARAVLIPFPNISSYHMTLWARRSGVSTLRACLQSSQATSTALRRVPWGFWCRQRSALLQGLVWQPGQKRRSRMYTIALGFLRSFRFGKRGLLEKGSFQKSPFSREFRDSRDFIRRMSETPATTTSQKTIAIHLQFVLQYASNLHCSAFGAPTLWWKGTLSALSPFVSQYASHLKNAIRLPFVLQYFLENLGGCGHRDVPYFREPPGCGKQMRIRPCSRDSREFRDLRDSRDSFLQRKAPFVMTPFSGPEHCCPLRKTTHNSSRGVLGVDRRG